MPSQPETYNYEGIQHTVKQLSMLEECEVSESTLYTNLKDGLSPSDAIKRKKVCTDLYFFEEEWQTPEQLKKHPLCSDMVCLNTLRYRLREKKGTVLECMTREPHRGKSFLKKMEPLLPNITNPLTMQWVQAG